MAGVRRDCPVRSLRTGGGSPLDTPAVVSAGAHSLYVFYYIGCLPGGVGAGQRPGSLFGALAEAPPLCAGMLSDAPDGSDCLDGVGFCQVASFLADPPASLEKALVPAPIT